MEKLDQRNPPKRFQIVVERDTKSGRWIAGCPFCERRIEGMTSFGTETEVFQHLNAFHVRRGH